MADAIDIFKTWLGFEGTEGSAAEQKKAPELTTDKHKIVEIIKELETRCSGGIAIADIVSEAKKIGFDEETTRAQVNELVRDGFIFRPRYMDDMVRLHGVSDYCPWSEDFPS